MKYSCIFILICMGPLLYGQDTLVTIQFRPVFCGQPVMPGSLLVTENDTIEMEVFRLYISGIRFCDKNGTVDSTPEKYHLLDLEEPGSWTILHSRKNGNTFDAVRFRIGIDSLTSVSGVFGDDLDPVNGMYWAWQSGYIYVKLEGKSMRCPARHHRFRFHIGGYQVPFYAVSDLEFQVSGTTLLVIDIALDRLFARVDLAKQYEIMGPGPQAVEMSRKMASVFQPVP